jgi:hypothetical protein
MVKKKPAAKSKPARKEAVRKVPMKTDMASVEEETIKRVNKTITTLEEFLVRWDASSLKPDDMFPQVIKIRHFHDSLLNWQKAAVKSHGRESEQSRLKRLRDFVLICRSYS